MCRVLAYLGEPILIEDLLYRPDRSLISQTHSAAMLNLLNLAGVGVIAWDEHSANPKQPFVYRSTKPAMFDRNLVNLAKKIRAHCILGHIRGVEYSAKVDISEYNLHPFRYDDFHLAMAHNGFLQGFTPMRYALLEHIKPSIAQQIRGNTDSEWVYALLMSRFDDPTADLDADTIVQGIKETIDILQHVREAHGATIASPLNLFLCDGNDLIALNYTFDLGVLPPDAPEWLDELSNMTLWYTTGQHYGLHDGEWKMVGDPTRADSALVASEPLTADHSTWHEVPDQHLLYIHRTGSVPEVRVLAL